MKLTQWFDMRSTDNPHDREDEQLEAMNKSVSTINEIINHEISLVGHAQKVILAGISQGCATAIHALLRQESQLGGFIGLSSWLPAKETLVRSNSAAYRTPVFLSHSKDDDVIDFRYGKELRDSLAQLEMNVEWHEYDDG
jgi:predicted esterase